MRWLVDTAYPDAPLIRLVLDNLNIHRMASLYETFPPDEARRIVKRLEFHHTPKHANWLNMAEIEFSVLSRACCPTSSIVAGSRCLTEECYRKISTLDHPSLASSPAFRRGRAAGIRMQRRPVGSP